MQTFFCQSSVLLMFLYLAISRKTSWSEILVNTFFSFCFLFNLSSASRNSRVVCSIVNIVYPFRIGTQTNGKALFYTLSTLAEKGKGKYHFYILACGLAVWIPIFAALRRLSWRVQPFTNIRKFQALRGFWIVKVRFPILYGVRAARFGVCFVSLLWL